MPHKVERWQCDFCKRRTLKSLKLIKQHETNCFDNPARKACRTCAFEDFDSNEKGQFRLCLNEHDYLEDPPHEKEVVSGNALRKQMVLR